METLKYTATIKKDGEINLKGVPCKKGQQVEMIILIDSNKVHKKRNKHFNAIHLKTSGFKFDRELANER
jgi:hypothetical protein